MSDPAARLHRDGQRILCGSCGRGVIASRLQCGADEWGVFLEPGVVETSPNVYSLTARAKDQLVRGQRPTLRRPAMTYSTDARAGQDGSIEVRTVATGERTSPWARPPLPFRRACSVCGRTALVTSDVLG